MLHEDLMPFQEIVLSFVQSQNLVCATFVVSSIMFLPSELLGQCQHVFEVPQFENANNMYAILFRL